MMDLSIDKIVNSSIGQLSDQTSQFMIDVIQPCVLTMVDLQLSTLKVPMGQIMREMIGIAGLDFDKSTIQYDDSYFTLSTSPVFNQIEKANSFVPSQENSVSLIDQSAPNDTITVSIIDQYLSLQRQIINENESVLIL